RYSINKNFDLYLIDVATKRQTQLTTNTGPDISPRFSPDGKQIAYLTSSRRGPHRDVFSLAIVAFESSGPKSRIVFEPGLKRSDMPPSFPLPTDCWHDPQTVEIVLEEGTWALHRRIDVVKGVEAEPDAKKLDEQLTMAT